jgi:hypothetical protein
MSRGPGHWQRAILQGLARWECFYLRAVLPPGHTRSDRLAVVRAAHRLAAQGRLQLDTFGGRLPHYPRDATGRVVVSRPDVAPDPDRAEGAWMTAHGWQLAGLYRIVRDSRTGAVLTRERVEGEPAPEPARDAYYWRHWIKPPA